MGGTGVIDHFLEVFTRYIDGGFGLLGGEVGFIATTLIVIDVTLAALFWSWGADENIIARLVKKTLFVGVFAYLISNWNNLARIVFESFAGLGLKASGTGFTTAQLLQPGQVAQTGLDASRPLLTAISNLMGYVSFFENFIQIACMLFAWALVLLAFFILAIQLFVTLIEFKLTTLAGFILVPFALWGKTAFLAEKTLGNVVASGVKVMVLAIIIGIGSTIFGELATTLTRPIDIASAMSLLLAALSLLGLGVFGPGIAAGLVSGAPQLGAGAAAGTVAGAAAMTYAGGALAFGGLRAVASGSAGAVRSAASLASSAANLGAPRAAHSAGGLPSAGARAPSEGDAGELRSASANTARHAPSWAAKLRREQHIRKAGHVAAHTLREGDKGGHGSGPNLGEG